MIRYLLQQFSGGATMAATVWKAVEPILVKVLGGLLTLVTPELKTELQSIVTGFYKKSLSTPNPWDDFLAGLLMDVFGFPKE